MNDKFERLIERAEQLIGRIESILPQPLQAPADWNAAIAWRYRRRSSGQATPSPTTTPRTSDPWARSSATASTRSVSPS